LLLLLLLLLLLWLCAVAPILFLFITFITVIAVVLLFRHLFVFSPFFLGAQCVSVFVVTPCLCLHLYLYLYFPADKNKDELPKETETLFRGSQIQLISSIFGSQDSVINSGLAVSAASESALKRRQESSFSSALQGGQVKVVGVGLQFKQQLSELMEKVYATKPHYIRSESCFIIPHIVPSLLK